MGIFNVRSVVSWVYLLAHFLCLSEQASINLPVDPSSTKRVQKRGRDYAAQVRCIGLSPLLSPIDSPSAQQLCSKAEYAPALPEGAEVPLRANAYCGSDPSSQRDIFFDHVGTEATIPPLVFAFCATRCRCIALTPPNSAQWLAPEILNNLPAQQQSWDKNPDGIYTYPKANTINYTIVTEDDVHSWISAAPAMISRSYEPATFYSPPTCLDTLPSLLPYPFQPEDFSTAQQLCAAIWYGGKSTGNAGFVCSPLVPGSSILFLTQDTVLAHPSLMWDRRVVNQDPLTSDTEAWCRSICSCNPQEPVAEQKSMLLEISASGSLYADFVDGRVVRRVDPNRKGPAVPKLWGKGRYPFAAASLSGGNDVDVSRRIAILAKMKAAETKRCRPGSRTCEIDGQIVPGFLLEFRVIGRW